MILVQLFLHFGDAGHGLARQNGSVAHLYRGEALKDDARLPHSFKCGVSGSLPKGIWQRRYFDVIIRHVRDFWNKLEYIHQNPVAARLVKRPDDWPWSSYAAYTKSTQPPIPVDPIELPVDRDALLWPAF